MAIRINNKEYLNYEEQVLKNKKDIEELIGEKNKSPNPLRIKTFTKDDFVTDGEDKVLSIDDGNVSTIDYDAVIIDLEGVGVTDGGNVRIELYLDITLQIHNSELVTDLAGNRTSSSMIYITIDTPIAKNFTMIKGYGFGTTMDAGGYTDLVGQAKAVNAELIASNGWGRRCDLVIYFSNPIYMMDFASEV